MDFVAPVQAFPQGSPGNNFKHRSVLWGSYDMEPGHIFHCLVLFRNRLSSRNESRYLAGAMLYLLAGREFSELLLSGF